MKRKVVLIGLGMIGKIHARILNSLPNFELIGVFDLDEEARKSLSRQYKIKSFDDIDAAIEAAQVVYVATPTSTHYDIAKRAIIAKRHVFIEKPIATNVKEANDLVQLAAQNNVLIGVGHVERFNPAVAWLRENVPNDEILSINIERVGPRPPRIKDVGIVTDLGVHDLDLLSFIANSPLQSVSCVASATLGEYEDTAQIAALTQNNIVGAITTNWLTPYKSRQIKIATSKKFFIADLLNCQISIYEGLEPIGERYLIEQISLVKYEGLRAESEAFAELLDGNVSGIITGEQGAAVVQWVQHCLDDYKRRII
ncbi:MAG: hypothetical protein RL757_576 [Bacteroidota bacterium]|jgi:predicted dehydrogenase